ncbi:kinesin motor domain-containing protein [Pavlovales sp. CCMP2436]|nr:kinesin motor domain-containing protein [Pavlovales sp. CCMP2436]
MQSGSGKTYTMEGSPDDPGVTYRAAARLFEVTSERAEQLFLGMVEIYNETLRDLLVDPTEVN